MKVHKHVARHVKHNLIENSARVLEYLVNFDVYFHAYLLENHLYKQYAIRSEICLDQIKLTT